ncbi:MAG TPA: DUF4097 family beta strand repeat-containing protein [Pyrinomonadaceae bacterium]|nr:DUF4097 family beta strand repeat-containing protein [Pyrinomonadaceae bacterium]
MIQNLKIKTGIILSIFLFAAAISAQVPKPVKPQFPKSETPAEKAIAVDAKVNISLCVAKGKINVNGWDRKEVRAYVSSGGSRVGFKVLKKDKNEKPVWIMVVGFDTRENGASQSEECLSGDDIELDVPRGAIVNIKSRDSETKIESVDKVRFSNVGGNVFFDNIANGIEAETKQGSITVGNSGGSIGLATTNGNIVVFNISPSEIGDVFRAKTINGTITLQEVEHLLLDVNSISGSIKFTGEPSGGGQYTFGTQSGVIFLSMPENSSCKINAFWQSGNFSSLMPMQNIKKTSVSGVQNLTGQIGAGEATINLTTFSGRIVIRKADK